MTARTRSDGRAQTCRICGADVFTLIDLGKNPFANALVTNAAEAVETYPLVLNVCSKCATAQLGYCANDFELYSNYLYVTPKSVALSGHYEWTIQFLKNHGHLSETSRVLEIGSNVGRFLEHIRPHVQSIIGVDPAINIAKTANKRGIPTVNAFFNQTSAKEILKQQGQKDLFVARHCFAHNEKPWLMLDGMQTLMHANSVLMIENAYFLDTVTHYEFDQIYHEHMYYHTLRSISEIASRRGLKLIDVIHTSIHGGTILYIVKAKGAEDAVSPRVAQYRGRENDMHRESFYRDFTTQIEKNKRELSILIERLKSQGKDNPRLWGLGEIYYSFESLRHHKR
ncbi:MAG: class I SAM-dependent methyltransferase [Chloroflexi bacterium]|nr:class I SAM-dependent methyltransferase [Chloroflexota bacterium]